MPLARWLRAALLSPRYFVKICRFYWYHKYVFRITNTKFDISYCVFQESFVRDQYNIRAFLDRLESAKTLFFLDLGRNHGFVFYYTLYHITKHSLPIDSINYVGIDPSPLKFVYYKPRQKAQNVDVNVKYNIIDRAVVFDSSKSVSLKYGEDNFGNFNISGSNYSDKLASQQSADRFVELNVETIQLSEILDIVRANLDSDALIVKIDCKNRTDCIFTRVLDLLDDCPAKYLVSCERDGSACRDVSGYVKEGENTLSVTNVSL